MKTEKSYSYINTGNYPNTSIEKQDVSDHLKKSVLSDELMANKLYLRDLDSFEIKPHSSLDKLSDSGSDSSHLNSEQLSKNELNNSTHSDNNGMAGEDLGLEISEINLEDNISDSGNDSSPSNPENSSKNKLKKSSRSKTYAVVPCSEDIESQRDQSSTSPEDRRWNNVRPQEIILARLKGFYRSHPNKITAFVSASTLIVSLVVLLQKNKDSNKTQNNRVDFLPEPLCKESQCAFDVADTQKVLSGTGINYGEYQKLLEFNVNSIFGPNNTVGEDYTHVCLYPALPGRGFLPLSGQYIHNLDTFGAVYAAGEKFNPMLPIANGKAVLDMRTNGDYQYWSDPGINDVYGADQNEIGFENTMKSVHGWAIAALTAQQASLQTSTFNPCLLGIEFTYSGDGNHGYRNIGPCSFDPINNPGLGSLTLSLPRDLLGVKGCSSFVSQIAALPRPAGNENDYSVFFKDTRFLKRNYKEMPTGPGDNLWDGKNVEYVPASASEAAHLKFSLVGGDINTPGSGAEIMTETHYSGPQKWLFVTDKNKALSEPDDSVMRTIFTFALQSHNSSVPKLFSGGKYYDGDGNFRADNAEDEVDVRENGFPGTDACFKQNHIGVQPWYINEAQNFEYVCDSEFPDTEMITHVCYRNADGSWKIEWYGGQLDFESIENGSHIPFAEKTYIASENGNLPKIEAPLQMMLNAWSLNGVYDSSVVQGGGVGSTTDWKLYDYRTKEIAS